MDPPAPYPWPNREDRPPPPAGGTEPAQAALPAGTEGAAGGDGMDFTYVEGQAPMDTEELRNVVFIESERSTDLEEARKQVERGWDINAGGIPLSPLVDAFVDRSRVRLRFVLELGADPNHMNGHLNGNQMTVLHWLDRCWDNDLAHEFAGMCWVVGREWDLHPVNAEGQGVEQSAPEEKLEWLTVRGRVSCWRFFR